MKTLLVALGLSVIIFTACKKDNGDDPPEEEEPPTAVEIITNAQWKIDTLGLDTDDNNQIDTEIPVDACGLDNTITFSPDSTGVFDFGATLCDDGESPINFTWYFKQNDQVLYIDGDLPGELEGDIQVITLNDSTLMLSKGVTLPPGANLIVGLKK